MFNSWLYSARADAFIGTEDYSNKNKFCFEVNTRQLTTCRPPLPSSDIEILAAGTPSEKKTNFIATICCKTHSQQQFAHFDCSFHSIFAIRM
jgi:hypothetical protein